MPSHNLVNILHIHTPFENQPEAGKSIILSPHNDLVQNMYFDGYELTPFNNKGKRSFFGVISLYNPPQSTLTQITRPRVQALSHPLQKIYLATIDVKVKELNNPAQIRIPATFLKKQEESKDQIAIERSLIRTAIANNTPVEDFCFDADVPLRSKRVSKFGSFRSLPNGYKYFHTGTDLRARTPVPIYAMAEGKVALAQKFVVPGNAVVIDHGNSIFSKYYHLSSILVEPGEKIKKGTMVGKSGGTGRVEAPHLHWEVSWKGIPTDPEDFLKTLKSVCI